MGQKDRGREVFSGTIVKNQGEGRIREGREVGIAGVEGGAECRQVYLNKNKIIKKNFFKYCAMCKDIAPALDSFSLGDGDVSTPYVTGDVCIGHRGRREESDLLGEAGKASLKMLYSLKVWCLPGGWIWKRKERDSQAVRGYHR